MSLSSWRMFSILERGNEVGGVGLGVGEGDVVDPSPGRDVGREVGEAEGDRVGRAEGVVVG